MRPGISRAVIATVFIECVAAAHPTRADYTVQAVMEFTLDCTNPNCQSASGTVTISNLGGPSCDPCPLDVSTSFNAAGCLATSQPSSLKLYESETTSCAGTGETELLASPTLPRCKWENLAKGAGACRSAGVWIIIAEFPKVGGGIARARGNPVPVPPSGVPTLSDWAVVGMMLSLIAAGTVVFRRAPGFAGTKYVVSDPNSISQSRKEPTHEC